MKSKSDYGLDRVSVSIEQNPDDSANPIISVTPFKDDVLQDVIRRMYNRRDISRHGRPTATLYEDGRFEITGFNPAVNAVVRSWLWRFQDKAKGVVELAEREATRIADMVLRLEAGRLLREGIDPDSVTFEVRCATCGPVGREERLLSALFGIAPRENERTNVITLPGSVCAFPKEYRNDWDRELIESAPNRLRAAIAAQLPKFEQEAARYAASLANLRQRLLPMNPTTQTTPATESATTPATATQPEQTTDKVNENETIIPSDVSEPDANDGLDNLDDADVDASDIKNEEDAEVELIEDDDVSPSPATEQRSTSTGL